MHILFVHGAGGWAPDTLLAQELQARLGVDVSVPRLPDDDLSAATWRREVDRHRSALGDDLVIVGHSFGASMALLHTCVDAPQRPLRGLVLLAMPFWGRQGWDVPEYELTGDWSPLPDVPIRLHHCLDDEIVPAEHVEHHASRLPHARIRRHSTGGHQLDGRITAVADDLAELIR